MTSLIKDGQYEYVRVYSSPTRFDLDGSINANHRLNYVKRRDRTRTTKYTGFLPSCSCKSWKSDVWFANKRLAIDAHVAHVKRFERMNPRFDYED